MMQSTIAQVPVPENGVEVVLGEKTASIETGCLIHYNGYRVATRVALYNHKTDKLQIKTAESFVRWAQLQEDPQGVIERYIYSCPVVPSPPLTYSKLQLKVEQNQIVVFQVDHNKVSRLKFGELDESEVPLTGKPQEFIDLFEKPSTQDWVYYRLRDYIDNTHVPNIADGRFNGLIDGKSVMGESTDPKWGKRSRLITTPKVHSTLDTDVPVINVFCENDCEQNPLGDPALLYKNYETDKADWARFLQDNGVFCSHDELEDLYFAINAGNLIGQPLHEVMTIDKRAKEVYWRRAHQGDKIVGMGQAIIDGNQEEAIIKGTVLEWEVPNADFLVADAYKGSTPNEVGSKLCYTYTTEYMSKGVGESHVPLSMYTYIDHFEDIADVQAILDGNDLDELIENMSYYDEDGESISTKAADVLRLSPLGMQIPAVWSGNGVNQHILSLIRNRMSPAELTLWKVLSFSIGKGVDNIYVPEVDAWRGRREIARRVANQLDADPEWLAAKWGGMQVDHWGAHINSLDIQVVAITVPVFPGTHTSHTLRVWDSDTIGLNPRLALSLLRDSDGDLACCLFPNE